MTKKMICISCPLGCELLVDIEEDGTFIGVQGNKCKRGYAYAQTEIINPTRMLTTTVKVNGGAAPLVSVKSAKPIPKGEMLRCMEEINRTQVDAPVAIGNVIIKDILKTGVDIIATSTVERKLKDGENS